MAYTVTCIFALLMMASVGGSMAAQYQVGDSDGWNNQGTDYEAWASSINFQVGDSIVFIYDKAFHNVLQVNDVDYNACSAANPYQELNDGNDEFNISSPETFYFICGFPNMCQQGQKVAIEVPSTSSTNPPPPSPPLPFFPTNPPPPSTPLPFFPTNPPPPSTPLPFFPTNPPPPSTPLPFFPTNPPPSPTTPPGGCYVPGTRKSASAPLSWNNNLSLVVLASCLLALYLH